MKEEINICDEFGWKEAEGYPAGTRIKTIRDENDSKTILLKLPKDFSMAQHAHLTAEQHFVLRGEYKSEGKIYDSGSYQFIPAGMDHKSFESENGAVILIIWDSYKNN